LKKQDWTRAMNRPAAVIGLVNIAHFIDHYAMLVFPAALIVMAPALGIAYGDLLPVATPGFIAFGAGAIVMGWLGDVWSRRHMMVIYYLGIGASLVGLGFASTPLQLGAGLFFVGLFASIYHPVGTAMIVAYAPKLGREIGINGVYGNVGVASSALVTGAAAQFLGWQAAFILPGLFSIAVGLVFAATVRHETRTHHKAATASARVPRHAMWRVFAALLLTVLASSMAFNAVTVALPKLFAERLTDLTHSPAVLGAIAAGVYLFGAAAQLTIGSMIDRHGLRAVFLPLCFVLAPTLFLATRLSGFALIPVAVGIIIALFGQVTINDAMIGKYTADRWRSRAYAARYFIGFTAAGGAVALVGALHARGGFTLTFEVLAALALFVVVAGLIFPAERAVPEETPSPAE
jgi:MFS family permease